MNDHRKWHGVHAVKVRGRNKYKARLTLEGTHITSEAFDDPREAAKAYDWIRIKNGFAPCNNLLKKRGNE